MEKWAMTTSAFNEETIRDYLKYYRTRDDHHWWAVEAVQKIIQSPQGLACVFQLIQASDDDLELAYVAAGPLEECFEKHHASIKDQLSTLVRQYPKMRKAIQAIFISKHDVRKTLDEILNKYGLSYASF